MSSAIHKKASVHGKELCALLDARRRQNTEQAWKENARNSAVILDALPEETVMPILYKAVDEGGRDCALFWYTDVRRAWMIGDGTPVVNKSELGIALAEYRYDSRVRSLLRDMLIERFGLEVTCDADSCAVSVCYAE